MTGPWYLTTTIPYVNARPHLGFALELVQADVLARHHRARGESVRLLSGTDDNSLKNVLAAEAAGLPVQEFVDGNAAAFEGLREALSLSFDDFIRTSRDPRHRRGVEALWQACAASGDLYRRHYGGTYCVGCEQYWSEAELAPDGTCPEHGTEPQWVEEENWFFRLSKYRDALREAVREGRLRVEPPARRNEVLGLLDHEDGLPDFSVSRSQSRARGWGIPVPGDPEQVVYVWWDALGNYVTSLGYGAEESDGGAELEVWWPAGDTPDSRRVHLVGKGVLRFHALYWPAMLLSAGLPLPTDILVHDYLTVDGKKISKSAGTGIDPAALAAEFGADAVRWWLLREVPRTGDADFTRERLIARANEDLANGLGNLVNRVVKMVHRYRDGVVPAGGTGDAALEEVRAAAPGRVDAAFAEFDLRRAAGAAWRLVEEANRYVERARPWEAARSGADEELDAALAALHATCRQLAVELGPFLPATAAGIVVRCETGPDGRLPEPEPLFPRIEVPRSCLAFGS